MTKCKDCGNPINEQEPYTIWFHMRNKCGEFTEDKQ